MEMHGQDSGCNGGVAPFERDSIGDSGTILDTNSNFGPRPQALAILGTLCGMPALSGTSTTRQLWCVVSYTPGAFRNPGAWPLPGDNVRHI